MILIPQSIRDGFLRAVGPIARGAIRAGFTPNVITTFGAAVVIGSAVAYWQGFPRWGGALLLASGLFDILDGQVARLGALSTKFGAFYDSTLDRIADGAVMSGLAFFYATSKQHGNVPMIAICLVGLLGGFLVSYTRARAEALGVNAKVGFMQRPERVVLLSAPQAFFGLALDGWVLAAIIVSLTVTSWATAIQRIVVVYRATLASSSAAASNSSRETVKPNPVPVAAEPPKPAKAVNV